MRAGHSVSIVCSVRDILPDAGDKDSVINGKGETRYENNNISHVEHIADRCVGMFFRVSIFPGCDACMAGVEGPGELGDILHKRLDGKGIPC